MNTQNPLKPCSTDELLARKYRTAYQAERHRAERLSFYAAGMSGVVLLLGFVIANGMQTQKALLDSANATIERLTAQSIAQQEKLKAAETTAFRPLESVTAQYLGEFDCTAYCCEPYPHVCGTGDGITASGAPVTAGVSVAVGGQGEGAARKIITVTLGRYAGDDRRELWVDAKDVAQTYQVATPDGQGGYTYSEATYTESQYASLLEARGLEKLAAQLKTLEVSAALGQGLMRYGQDYFLGDIVPLKITRYGLRLSARVSAVRTVYEKTGKSVNAILSDFALKKEAKSL